MVICSGTQSDIPARIVKVLKHYKYRKIIMFAGLHFFDLVLNRNFVLLFSFGYSVYVSILFFRKCNNFLAFSYFVIGKLPVREKGEN